MGARRRPRFLDEIIIQLGAGKIHSVAVVVPRGARWSVPAYELALVLAWSTAIAAAAHVTLITSEQEPLAALGAATSAAVVRELDAAGVEVVAAVEAVDAPSAAADPGRRVNGAQLVLLPEDAADAADALTGQPTDPARVRRQRRLAGRLRPPDLAADRRRSADRGRRYGCRRFRRSR